MLNDGKTDSQLAFWELNLKSLQAKEEALVDFFKALCDASDEFKSAAILIESKPYGIFNVLALFNFFPS